MASAECEFSCYIDDTAGKEQFSAIVKMVKKVIICSSRKDDRTIELAHIYITPVSGQFPTLARREEPVFENGEFMGTIGVASFHSVHHHFILFSIDGRGKYLVRNSRDQTERVRICTTWDLGHSFARQVAETLTKMM